MKEFFDIMMKDIQEDDFTAREWMVYGVIAPMALITTLIILSVI